jgi:hypothetical protein
MNGYFTVHNRRTGKTFKVKNGLTNEGAKYLFECYFKGVEHPNVTSGTWHYGVAFHEDGKDFLASDEGNSNPKLAPYTGDPNFGIPQIPNEELGNYDDAGATFKFPRFGGNGRLWTSTNYTGVKWFPEDTKIISGGSIRGNSNTLTIYSDNPVMGLYIQNTGFEYDDLWKTVTDAAGLAYSTTYDQLKLNAAAFDDLVAKWHEMTHPILLCTAEFNPRPYDVISGDTIDVTYTLKLTSGA